MKIKEVLDYLGTIVPLEKAEPWDHSGLQLGQVNDELNGIMLCLNVDASTINQALNNHCNLMISHHPFLFNQFNTIDLDTRFGQNIETLIHNHMTVYALHTNYDKLRMNNKLLEKIGCMDISGDDILHFGKLPSALEPRYFIEHIKQLFDLKYVRVVGQLPKTIQNISICAGSGHDYMHEALNQSDVFLTGDLTYTHAMDLILRKSGAVIEVPHFIEAFFKEDMQQLLLDNLDIEALVADEKDYFEIY